MKEYGVFFQDYGDSSDTNKFCFKIIDNTLPKFSTREHYIAPINSEDLSDSNILYQTKDLIKFEDEGIFEVKEVPIDHFVINFVPYLIENKLDSFAKDNNFNFYK